MMNLTASDSKIIQTPKPSVYETHADSSILIKTFPIFCPLITYS